MSVDNFLLMLFISAVIGGAVGYFSCLFIQGRREVEAPESNKSHEGFGRHAMKPILVKPLPLSPYSLLLGEIRETLKLNWVVGTSVENQLRTLLDQLESMDVERAREYQAYLKPYIGHYVRFIASQPLWTNSQERAYFISRAQSNLDGLNGGDNPIYCVLSYFEMSGMMDLMISPGITFGDALLTVFTRDELELIEWEKENGTLNIDHRDRIISGPTHQPCSTCQD